MKQLITRIAILSLLFIASYKANAQCNATTTPAADSICSNQTLPFSCSMAASNNGMTFNGSSGYLTAPQSASLSLFTNMTISCWVKLNAVSNQKILGKTTPSFNGGYLMGIDAGGLVYFQLWNTSATQYLLHGQGNITTGVWTHLTMTYSMGGKFMAYVNGVPKDSIAVAALPVGTNSNPFIIGLAPWDLNSFKMNGSLDEVRIYNTALTQAEIAATMNTQIPTNTPNLVAYWNFDEGAGATVPDHTTNANTLTLTNSPTWLVPSTCPAGPTVNYLWSPTTNLSSSTLGNPIFTPSGAGVYTYYVTASNPQTLCSDVDTVSITVFTQPVLSCPTLQPVCINATPFDVACTPGGGVCSGSGVTGTLFNPAVAGAGPHNITYNIAHPVCPAIQIRSITVYPLPVVTTGTDTSVCAGSAPVLLSGSPVGGAFTGNGMSGNFFDPSAVGAANDTIVYSYTDNHGCVNRDSLIVFVQPLPLVNAGNDTTMCKGDTIQLHAQGSGSFAWNQLAVISDTTVADPLIWPNYSDNFIVHLYDGFGCMATDTVHVTVQVCAPAGIHTENDAHTLSIYPNPGNGHLLVSAKEQIRALQIYDSAGRLVINETYVSGTFSETVVLETSGLYLLRLTLSDGVHYRKLMVY